MTEPARVPAASPLRLYNTLGRRKEVFRPLRPPRVLMYSCGPTVYHFSHIGNMRSFVAADVLRRVLEYNGYQVDHVKNITDVGHLRNEVADTGVDRVEEAARGEGKTVDEVVAFYTDAYLQDEARLNVLPPRARPRASQFIAQMIQMIEKLIEQGHAYEADGNVYFSVRTFPSYGELSGNRQDDLIAGQRVEVELDKRDPADFALWKKGDPSRLMNWDSPWGRGFPGWHIECSVMASDLLGPQIDIHTGGIDNLFPHHEDERAQSEAVSGERFVGFWVHGAHLLIADERMAKSLGNTITVAQLAERGIDPLAFRYFLLQAHYRTTLSLTNDSLAAAQTGLSRLIDDVAQLLQEPESGDEGKGDEVRLAFLEAINDDLSMPSALALVQDLVAGSLSPVTKLHLVEQFDRVLGLDLLTRARGSVELTEEEQQLIFRRETARRARDWRLSDQLRDELAERGVEVRDGSAGQRWIKRAARSGA